MEAMRRRLNVWGGSSSKQQQVAASSSKQQAPAAGAAFLEMGNPSKGGQHKNIEFSV
jgi:hypothetical protein